MYANEGPISICKHINAPAIYLTGIIYLKAKNNSINWYKPMSKAKKHQAEISGFMIIKSTATATKMYQLNFTLVKELNKHQNFKGRLRFFL